MPLVRETSLMVKAVNMFLLAEVLMNYAYYECVLDKPNKMVISLAIAELKPQPIWPRSYINVLTTCLFQAYNHL